MKPRSSHQPGAWLPAVNLAVILFIGVIDLLTPDATFGILLSLPILASSASDDPRFLWLNFFVALAVFLNAVAQEPGPVSPMWLPNRILILLTLPASLALALVLQRRRLHAEAAREEALRSRDLNRLLLSLLAHDLRAPLGVAVQALEYVGETAGKGEPFDMDLVGDVRARLRRSLGSVDNILNLVRETDSATATEPMSGAALAIQLALEADAFAEEARRRGMSLQVEIASEDESRYDVDLLVARQAVAILVDNAVRHARPGEIRVGGTVAEGELQIRVSDQGPGLSAQGTIPGSEEKGLGLGLQLCRALIARAEGRLDVVRDAPDGTEFLLRLPLQRARGKNGTWGPLTRRRALRSEASDDSRTSGEDARSSEAGLPG